MPYGLLLVSVQVWGVLWGCLSLGFIVGGLVVARQGLGADRPASVLSGQCRHVDCLRASLRFTRRSSCSRPDCLRAHRGASARTKRGGYAETADALIPLITGNLRAGDVVLVKGFNGSRMSRVVDALAKLQAGVA